MVGNLQARLPAYLVMAVLALALPGFLCVLETLHVVLTCLYRQGQEDFEELELDLVNSHVA